MPSASKKLLIITGYPRSQHRIDTNCKKLAPIVGKVGL